MIRGSTRLAGLVLALVGAAPSLGATQTYVTAETATASQSQSFEDRGTVYAATSAQTQQFGVDVTASASATPGVVHTGAHVRITEIDRGYTFPSYNLNYTSISSAFVLDDVTVQSSTERGYLLVAIRASGIERLSFNLVGNGSIALRSFTDHIFGWDDATTSPTEYDFSSRYASTDLYLDGVETYVPPRRVQGNYDPYSPLIAYLPFISGRTYQLSLSVRCEIRAERVFLSSRPFTARGTASADCSRENTFGWGGVLAAVDESGNAIGLPSLRSQSGTDYLFDLTAPTIPGVPEPKTWLSMLLGFALIGSRKRQKERHERILQQGFGA